MIYFRIEGEEKLKAGIEKGQILKNSEDWNCEKQSCICIFKPNELKIEKIFSDCAHSIAEIHECKKGERIFLLRLEKLNMDHIKEDDSGAGGCWDYSKKYQGDISISDIIVVGYAKVTDDTYENYQLSDFTKYEKPKKITKVNFANN